MEDVAEQSVIEPSIMEQNKRHLEQRCREKGLSAVPAIVALEGEYGMNEHVEALFEGSYNPEGVSEAMTAYFRAFQKKGDEDEEDIEDTVGQEEYQVAFRNAQEKTSLNSTKGLNTQCGRPWLSQIMWRNICA